MYEDDIEYASRRLNNTLVRLNTGEPFFVTRTMWDEAGVMVHRGENMVSGESVIVKHTDLNLEPVPLGFINTDRDMVFVARKPMRRDWRQGLSHNSLVTYGKYRADEVNFRWLVQPITGKYPSFSRALTSLARKNSIAFSRDFGLTREDDKITLCYRRHPVGYVEEGQPVLYPQKQFLQQHLAEAMG